MKSNFFLLSFTLLVNVCFSQSKTQDHLDYIEKYKDIAMREMVRVGIPASIKLAQAILESEAGKSDLARRANNHFGIKCNPEWEGKTYYKKDDDYDDRGKLIESCFRVYQNAEASFIAHSEFLRDPKKLERYGWLFSLEPNDYRRWAKGLRSSGYATAVDYDRKLISLIERYELHKYDQLSLAGGENITVGNERPAAGYMVNNDVRYVLAMDNEPLEEIARRTFTSVSTLLNYNENLRTADQRLSKDTKIYLQPKRSAYRGKQTWHYVKQGETMQDISNQYAVKLDALYERNRMPAGAQPAPNERVKLRGGTVSAPPKTVADLAQNHLENTRYLFDEELAAAERPQLPNNTRPITPEIQTNVVVTGNKDQVNPPAAAQASPLAETGKPEAAPKPVPVSQNLDDDFFDTAAPLRREENAAVYHTVIKGDTLWNVAQRYGTTVVALKKLNNLNSDAIQLGIRLQIR